MRGEINNGSWIETLDDADSSLGYYGYTGV